MWNVIFLVTGAIFIALLITIFFSKEVMNSKENNYFRILMIVNVLEYLIELPLQLLVKNVGVDFFLVDVFSRFYLMSLFTWFTFFSIYAFVICLKKTDNDRLKVIKISNYIVLFIGLLLFAILPFSKYHELDKMYIYGPAVNMLKLFLGLYMLVWIVLLFKNIQRIKSKKYAPLFLIILLGFINVVIQTIDPSVLIASMMATFICYTMYFTIENPDLKMLREFQEAKDYAEKSNNEKTMFLYDLSQKVKIPVTRILRQSENIIKDSNDEIVNEEAGDIKYYSKKLLQVVDNVLDISNLERYDFKLVNSTYNIELLLKEIEIMARKSIIEKEVEFRSNISNSLPKLMYGDSIRLKQIINIVLDNAIKYTDKGFIELTVNSVIKHDVCRLIITVEDSGMGMSNEKVEEIFDKERMLDEKNLGKIDTEKANLAIASSLAKIIGGTILVSSEIGRGTNVTIVLDQKISEEYKTNMEKNAEEYYEQMTKEKVLVVGMELDKRTKQVLNKMDLVVEEVELGIDCLNRVRNGLKYKKIIMSEKMDKLDGMTVYKKLQEVSDFNIPVIMVGEEKNRQILAKYKEEGISEYVNKVTKDNITELMK